jgi:hypothetical protein
MVAPASPRASNRDYSEFWSDFELIAARHGDAGKLKADVERAIAGKAAEARIGEAQPEQVVLRALRDRQWAARGGIVFRVFWWGFHLEIPSPDLKIFAAQPGEIVRTLEAIAASAPALVPYVLAAIGFLNTYPALLRRIDAGRGIYVGMLWSAPGLFVPSPVR